jgi:phage gp45-like
MMFDANLTRMEFDGTVDHRDGQQFVDGRGFAGDRFERTHRIEPHGFASWPVKGGIGVTLGTRGRRDAAYVFGGENPKLRPQVGMGGTAIYDHAGNIISVVMAELRIVHSAKVTIVAPEIVLDGLVKLGGEDADRPASAEGTVDSAGHTETGNLATRVLVK